MVVQEEVLHPLHTHTHTHSHTPSDTCRHARAYVDSILDMSVVPSLRAFGGSEKEKEGGCVIVRCMLVLMCVGNLT